MEDDGSKTVEVKVRWRGKDLTGIEIDTSETPEVFKLQLFSLTGVPPERQTIIGFKGGKLRDESDWKKVGLKPNMKIMLMGTPAEEAEKLEKKEMPKIRNDLGDNPEEEVEVVPLYPPGLKNLGNTCYMNATVQCLKSVGELKTALRDYRGSSRALNPAEKLTAGLRDLISRLNTRNTTNINPLVFLTTLRQVNPLFAEIGQHGIPMQQDAEECWSEILTNLSTALAAPNVEGQANSGTGENPVDRMFGIKMRSTDRCLESEQDEPVVRGEMVRALKCHISSSVNHLNQGVKESLEETIEKRSDALDRTANWSRKTEIEKLPPYLIVQFVRFFWKASDSVKAKILRQVSFPVNFDVYDFCTEELKKELSDNRKSLTELEEKNALKEDKRAGAEVTDTAGPASDAAPSQEIATEIGTKSNGVYELCAVLTHKGRAADTGHYVAWVKEDDKWMKYDDDQVSVHTEEDVKKLSGGGDWHMAYMCLYRMKGLKS